jgi:glycosyltransferase involved in cell wall biosynthesis
MQVIFWQNILSIHQSVFIRNLAEKVSVTLIAEKEISAQRMQIGWQVPDFGAAELIVSPDNETFDRLCSNIGTDTVHVMSGIDAYPMVYRAFRRMTGTGARIGLMAEALDGDGFKGKLRFVKSWLQARLYSSKLEFILATGYIGECWFLRTGFPLEKIYLWGYFVETPGKLERMKAEESKDDDPVRIVFIGACIRLKRIDLLLNALQRLSEHKWELCIIGDGPERGNLESFSSSLGLGNKVSFMGVQPNQKAMELLINSDLLVLPSRYDGWGAVVNEALCRGVQVVCSDNCGAADLVWSSGGGRVFSSGSVDSLSQCLREQILMERPSAHKISALREWANDVISGQAVADYFLNIINASGTKKPKPKAPWKKLSGE